MAWTERQHALLQEMGVRLWTQPLAAPGLTSLTEDLAPTAPTAPSAPSAPSAIVESRSPTAASAPVAELPVRPAAAPVEPTRLTRGLVPAAAEAPRQVVQSLPASVAALNWLELRAAVAECRACSLCEGRRQTVFGVGHPQSHWMIIGEAPGEQEDLHGEPFVGPAGQLLDRMLNAVGVRRASAADAAGAAADPASQAFIANVLKCRPPNNRNPDAEEVARCAPFLQRQVELVRPRLILAMGRFAVQAILQTQEPIGRLRGKVHRYQGVPVVVTYHPAYLLRNPLDKARSWEDLCLAASAIEAAAQDPLA